MDFELTPREQARLAAAAELLSAAAETPVSVELARTLPSVRLAVLTSDGLDTELALRELQTRPEIAAHMRAKAVAAALNDLDSDVHKDIARLTPEARLNLGRKIEAEKAAQPAPQLSPAEEARVIAQIRNLPPAQRLTGAASGKIRRYLSSGGVLSSITTPSLTCFFAAVISIWLMNDSS